MQPLRDTEAEFGRMRLFVDRIELEVEIRIPLLCDQVLKKGVGLAWIGNQRTIHFDNLVPG